MMNRTHMLYFIVCILILSMGSPAYSGSKSDNVNLCDPDIIAQIQEGQSTKEDVRQLIGEPQKIEALMNDQEVWKYKSSVTAHSGSGRQSGFGTSGQLQTESSSTMTSRTKNCNVHVVFEKNGTVKKVRESKVSGFGAFGN